MAEPTLPEKVIRLARSLGEASLPFAFGGALALAYYAEPRTTIDIDLNVFVGPDRYPEVRQVLRALGVGRFPPMAIIQGEGQGRSWWGRTPIDLFFSYAPIHAAMQRDARRVPFGDIEIPVLGAEHLVVAKVVFNRPKDWIDIEEVLVTVPRLDLGEIRRWLAELVGPEDARHVRFDKGVDRLLGHNRD